MSKHELGRRISEVRVRRRMSQTALAQRVGVSQTTISRMERRDVGQYQLRLLSVVAEALACKLEELLPAHLLAADGRVRWIDDFYVFCPNPFCQGNRVVINQQGVACGIHWGSCASRPIEQFDDVVYCHRCGEELVKQCPQCRRPITQPHSNHCEGCGAVVCDRPTGHVIKQLSRRQPRESYRIG